MTNPIEVMAKAYWNQSDDVQWEDIGEAVRRRMTQKMRTAVSALSECDLPEEVVEAGVGRLYAVRSTETSYSAVEGFRAMLKKLAENGK